MTSPDEIVPQASERLRAEPSRVVPRARAHMVHESREDAVERVIQAAFDARPDVLFVLGW